ncbi:S8/S53 family peptidase [Deinococcus sp.]|uniref:S8/S53 family peptidase n=1 Tax=Deinococcus sp. TaxID=47478 RepID=UPI0028699878|nr:S8/S53 family peptidase [Deinococcus sp.]
MERFLGWCRVLARWVGGWGRLVVGLLVLGASASAQPVRAVPDEAFAVFPPVASAGERVWLIGRAVQGARVVWVGGHAAKLTPDTPPGWYAFQVPQSVPGGFQGVSVQGPARPGSQMLSIIPPQSRDTVAAHALTAYLRADARPGFQDRYVATVQRLAEACARLCPSELTETVRALTRLDFSTLTPLTEPGALTVVPPRRGVPTVLPVNPRALVATGLNRILKAPEASSLPLAGRPGGGLCAQWAGDIDIGSLPQGRVLALLDLLFWGDLGIDPIAGSHPTATGPVPFRGLAPLQMLQDAAVLGPLGGGGAGVTIHVLDTASPTDDPFEATDVNYYNEVFPSRPGHGSVVGAVAQAVSPDAKVTLAQVCTLDGGKSCRTLDAVRALCEVVSEARQGGKHVVNLSLGGAYPSLGLLLALHELSSVGVPTAASYGNRDDCHGLIQGDRCSHYPADWSNAFTTSTLPDSPTMLLSVAGWDVGNREYATYNRTAVIPWALTALPSVQAPGEFWFQMPGMTESMPYFGTSFAAPVVAGVLANWMSCRPGVPFLPLITTPGISAISPAVLHACP